MFEEFGNIINISGFIVANLIAIVGKSFTDYVKSPLKYKGIDTWWASYIALAFGIVMVAISGANMFSGEYLNGAAGIFITGLYAGGVSIGIYDFTSKRAKEGAEEDSVAEDAAE